MALKSLDAYAAYLAQQHAQDQETIAAQLAVGLYPLWNLVNFQELDDSIPTWLAATLPRIKTAYLQSQRVSAVFTQNVRFASLPLEDPLPLEAPHVELPSGLSPGAFDMPDAFGELIKVADEFDVDRVSTSLLIQADYKTKQQMPGPEEDLMHNALVRSSGTAVREAINGARNVVSNIAKRDRKVIGYARVTDSNPCYFCALLASRGGAYAKNAFDASYKRPADKKSDADFISPQGRRDDLPADFSDVAKVHNNCKCTLRPVYSKSQSMDVAAKYYKAGWDDVHETHSRLNNRAQVNEFRKWLKGHPFEGAQADLYSLKKDLADRESSLLNAGFSASSPQVRWAAQQQRNVA